MSDPVPPAVPQPALSDSPPANVSQPHFAPPGYAPPPAQDAVPGAWPAPPSPTRRLRGIGAATRRFLVAYAVLAALLIVIRVWGIFELAAYSDGTAGIGGLQAYDTLAAIVSIPLLAASVGAGICWVVWQYRAAASVPQSALRRSPGWHAGAWFVPIISFWWPFQNASDLARGSRADLTAGTLRAWWALWVIGSLVSGIGTRVLPLTATPTIASLVGGTLVDILSEVLLIAAAPLAITIVARITDAIDPRAR